MDNLHNYWHSFLTMSLATIALGAAAFFTPFQSGLNCEIMVGLILLGVGLTHALHSFWGRQSGSFLFELYGAMHYLLVGFMLFTNPGSDRTMLILLLAMLFIMQGMLQFGLLSQTRLSVNQNWMLISAVLAIALGVIIWTQSSNAPYWLIGIFVGVHLLVRGLGTLTLAFATRRLAYANV